MDFKPNATGHNVFLFNNATFRANYNNPLLLLANQKNHTPFQPEWNIYNFGSNKTIRLVINNLYVAVHPMHIHGHNMVSQMPESPTCHGSVDHECLPRQHHALTYQQFVLSEGDGPWDGHTITNPQNPQRRDTQMLRRYGHMVIQIDADNPGVWPFHCHIAWHQSMGMSLNIMERPDEIKQRQIPMVMAQTCRDWDAYSSKNVVEQIDAGI